MPAFRLAFFRFKSLSRSPDGWSIGQSRGAKARMLRRALRAIAAIHPSDTIPALAPAVRGSPQTQVFLATPYPPVDPLCSRALEQNAHRTPEGRRPQPEAVRSPAIEDGT